MPGNWSPVYSASIELSTTKPVLTKVSIESDHTTNNQYAKNGNTITISIVSDKTLSVTPTVTIKSPGLEPARVMSVSGSDKTYAATYTIPIDETLLDDGLLTINISGFEDEFGNVGETVLNTTDSTSITYDKTPPSLQSVNILSNNSRNTSYAKVGDTITITFTASEKIYTPAVKIGGHVVTPTEGVSNSWTASYTMTEEDAEGEIALEIKDYADIVRKCRQYSNFYNRRKYSNIFKNFTNSNDLWTRRNNTRRDSNIYIGI